MRSLILATILLSGCIPTAAHRDDLGDAQFAAEMQTREADEEAENARELEEWHAERARRKAES